MGHSGAAARLVAERARGLAAGTAPLELGGLLVPAQHNLLLIN